MRTPYWSAFRALRGVHLEESTAVSVSVIEQGALFTLVVVPTPVDSRYIPPAAGVDHDRRPAELLVTGDGPTVSLTGGGSRWIAPPGTRFPFGRWTVADNGLSELSGPWGAVQVYRARVLLHLNRTDQGGSATDPA